MGHSKEHLKPWWEPVLNMKVEDPQQDRPFWVGTNNAVLNTPYPGIQIKAYAEVSSAYVGVFLSGTRLAYTLAIQNDLLRERKALLRELPKGTEIKPGNTHPIVIATDRFRTDDQKRTWLIKTINLLINVLRPRLAAWYKEAKLQR
jgi:hypothetical protein